MSINSREWMRYSIDIANKASQSRLRVGAVLVSQHNELICSSYKGEEDSTSWSSVLIDKIRRLEISHVQTVYLTINTLSTGDSFELNELLKEINADIIYVGVPDPTLSCYLENDPIIASATINRYPDELQREILKQNQPFFANSVQSIKYSPFYSKNRISNLVIQKLKVKGFAVSKKELTANKKKSALASLVCDKYGVEYSDALCAVYNAISEAFDDKYSTYTYANDTRSLDANWKENFLSVYALLSSSPIITQNIINVGVGSGVEAKVLFSNCACVTFVDIAQAGLNALQAAIPLARFVVSSADDLSFISNCCYDLYISLRTYNSSFFDIKEAISEAHRVLKPGGAIIVSVANGFLCSDRHCIIPGLITPGTEFVDIYRGMDTIKLIHTEFIKVGFKNIQVFATNTEIYLSALRL